MNLTHTETSQLFDMSKIAFGALIAFAIGYFKDKASGRKATASQLHKDVNEFIAAVGELQVTLAGIREQHDSGRGRYFRVALLVLQFIAHGGTQLVPGQRGEVRSKTTSAHIAADTAIRAGAAAAVNLMHWDRGAVTSVNSAIVGPLARVTLATATLRSSGDEQFNKVMITATDAVLALPEAYGKSSKEWQAANDAMTDAITALVKEAKRVTAARWWMGLRKARE